MTLFIDACLRKDSRTRKLCRVLLDKLGEPYETLELYNENLPRLTEELLDRRTLWCKEGDYSDNYFKYARQFAAADKIVIAAPFWDLSFPSVLKDYIENICISGLTFKYSEEGIPLGLCRAEKLYYVTTSGGRIFDSSFGFGYIRSLFENMFGIKDCRFYSAENLDVYGSSPEEIIGEAIKNITV